MTRTTVRRSQPRQAPTPSRLRRPALASIALGAALLAAGFMLHSDLLGFLFLVCLLLGLAALAVDAVLQRRRSPSPVPARK